MRPRSLLVIATALLLGIVLVNSSVTLAARESLTVSPPQAEFKLTPGQQTSGAVKLKNSGEKSIDVDVYADLFSIKNEQYDQEFRSTSNELAANNWLSFDKSNYHLEPKEEKIVNYQVKVPKNAEPGGHYVAIFAQTKSNDQSKKDVVEIKRIASLLYFEIAGNISRTGSIESLQTSYWHKSSPIKSQLRLKNDGNTHYQVDGYVKIKNMLGSEVVQNRVAGLLMPKTTRLFEIGSEAPDWPGLYRLEAQISFPDGKPKSTSTQILYLPPLYIYIAAILLAIVVAIIFWRRKQSKKPSP